MATCFVKLTTAPFDAQYADRSRSPTKAATEAVLTIAPARPVEHRRQERLRPQEDAADVDGEDAVPLLRRAAQDVGSGSDPGVVHQHVDGADAVTHHGHRGRVRHVRGFAGHALGDTGHIDVDADDARPTLAKLCCHRASDSASRACHDRRTTVEVAPAFHPPAPLAAATVPVQVGYVRRGMREG
jgi:hypothetical protein